MRFDQKLSASLVLLQSTGMWRSNYAPPLYNLLWKLGLKLPPPHFASFATNFVFDGLFFGFTWGLLMWFAMWLHQGMSPERAVVQAIFAGLFFGIGMASYYRYDARKHRIPLWKDFRPMDDGSLTRS